MDQLNSSSNGHQQHQPKSKEFIKSLGQFFKRDLISIPLIKKYPHPLIGQQCGLKAATLELDTAAYPNIEYIAGNRLSIYPTNPLDHVNVVIKHVIDDVTPMAAAMAAAVAATKTPVGSATNQSASVGPPAPKRSKPNPAIVGPRMSEPWAQFVATNGKDCVRLALLYLYDITTAPSRDLLRLMAECCSNRDQKSRLIQLSRTDENWEKWVCQSLRTLKSTLDEFSSCQISAKSLFSELHLQQPRQYSISSIKSSNRFRTEIIVVQHKFNNKQITLQMLTLKEREKLEMHSVNQAPRSPQAGSYGPLQTNPTTVHVNHADTSSDEVGGGRGRSLRSVRSLRPMEAFGTSPISSQQVKRVPHYSGPLMSMYAMSSLNAGPGSRTSLSAMKSVSSVKGPEKDTSASQPKHYDENPRFTLKGNRERPIMMIGQDVGVLAYRAFWQQRALEHDRAQVFYTLFKDLSPKKFGDMQLVCLTGNRCKIEDLFKREMNSVVTNKIMSSVTYINKSHLMALLDSAANSSQSSTTSNTRSKQQPTKLPIEAKELIDLGNRISKLLTESNGCIYTCCDPQMTQAIEILAVESIARNNSGLARDVIMSLLPKWKGRRQTDTVAADQNNNSGSNKFLFTIENPFERAQIVQEIYDSSI